jgi:thiosulfate dehydrogenase [quinone] large subunit
VTSQRSEARIEVQAMGQGSRFEAFGLAFLRTVIGWHFLYEGYYKLMLPGWTRAGAPLTHWSAAGYLKAASGPFAGLAHAFASPAVLPWLDMLIPIGLLLVGLSLLLGLFTQLGAWGALAFLTLFYLTAIPMNGVPQPNAEGTYLIVNKTLVEWAAVLVVIAFRTGRIAGLDTLWPRRTTNAVAVQNQPTMSAAAARQSVR